MGRKFTRNEVIKLEWQENEIFYKYNQIPLIVKTGSEFEGTQDGEKKILTKITLIDSKYEYLLDEWKISYDNTKDKDSKDKELTKGYFEARNKNTNNKIYLHRLIYCLEHNLSLDDVDGKHIHHLNGLSYDNTSKNLELVSKNEHKKIEDRTKYIEKIGNKYYMNSTVSTICTLYKKMDSYKKPVGEIPAPTEDRDLMIKQVEEYIENNKHILND